MTVVGHRWASKIEASRWVTVVLPLVPVTPTVSSDRAGWPKNAHATRAMDRPGRARGHHGLGHVQGQATLDQQGRGAAGHGFGGVIVAVADSRPGRQQNSGPGTDVSAVELDRR